MKHRNKRRTLKYYNIEKLLKGKDKEYYFLISNRGNVNYKTKESERGREDDC